MLRLRPLVLATALPAIAALFLASCHGVVTLEQACADRAAAICARLAADCRPSALAGTFGDDATCRRRSALACTSTASLRSPAWQPAEVAACTAEIAGAACDLYEAEPAMGPACAKLWRGPLEADAPCSIGLQCRSGTCNVDVEAPRADGCGTCTRAVALGDTCATNDGLTQVSCDPGLYCDFDTNRCAAPKAKGEACSNDPSWRHRRHAQAVPRRRCALGGGSRPARGARALGALTSRAPPGG